MAATTGTRTASIACRPRPALRNFAGEMNSNRQATQRNRQSHETLARELHDFLASKEPRATTAREMNA